ncbi:MAG: hypothetical protein ACWGO1_02900, partial [Anaerolineales bacterium]
LSWTALYFVAYSLLGVSRYFWYYALLVPGMIALVGLGINALVDGGQKMCASIVGRHRSEAPSGQGTIKTSGAPSCRSLSLLAAAVLLTLITAAQVYDIWNLRSNPDSRSNAYQVVGKWIRENTPQDALVSSLEIGIIGYYAERRMVDFAGLLRPEVAHQLRQSESYDHAATWTVENFAPDYVVLVKGDLRPLRQGYLKEHCRLAQHFQSDYFGYADNINLYACH